MQTVIVGLILIAGAYVAIAGLRSIDVAMEYFR